MYYINQINDPNWVEILEAFATAFGAVFAIFGVVIAWRSLRKDMMGQQKQIDSLVNQSNALLKQTEALSESMKIDSQILTELTKHFAKSEKISKLEQEKVKLDVRPDIKIKGTGNSGNLYGFNVENKGLGEARNVMITTEGLIIEGIILHPLPFIDKLKVDKYHGFNITKKIEGLLPESLGIFLNIKFEDIYGNKYKTKFEAKGRGTDIYIQRIEDQKLTNEV